MSPSATITVGPVFGPSAASAASRLVLLVALCAFVGLSSSVEGRSVEWAPSVWTARRRVGDGRPADWPVRAQGAAGLPPLFTPPPPPPPQAASVWIARRRVGDGRPADWPVQVPGAAAVTQSPPPPPPPPLPVFVWTAGRRVDGRPLAPRQTASVATSTAGHAGREVDRPTGRRGSQEAGEHGKRAERRGEKARKRGRNARKRGGKARKGGRKAPPREKQRAATDGIVVGHTVNDRLDARAPWLLSSSATWPFLPPSSPSTLPPLPLPPSSPFTQPPLPPPSSTPVTSLTVSREADERARTRWILYTVVSQTMFIVVVAAAAVAWNRRRNTRLRKSALSAAQQTLLAVFTVSENVPPSYVDDRTSIPYDPLYNID